MRSTQKVMACLALAFTLLAAGMVEGREPTRLRSFFQRWRRARPVAAQPAAAEQTTVGCSNHVCWYFWWMMTPGIPPVPNTYSWYSEKCYGEYCNFDNNTSVKSGFCSDCLGCALLPTINRRAPKHHRHGSGLEKIKYPKVTGDWKPVKDDAIVPNSFFIAEITLKPGTGNPNPILARVCQVTMEPNEELKKKDKKFPSQTFGVGQELDPKGPPPKVTTIAWQDVFFQEKPGEKTHWLCFQQEGKIEYRVFTNTDITAW